MASPNRPNSLDNKIAAQLKRMLKSKPLAKHPKKANIFEYLVNAALAGNEVTEKDILAIFFPDHFLLPDQSIARTTISQLRGILRDYYLSDGQDDPIVITLPPKKPGGSAMTGEHYTPLFNGSALVRKSLVSASQESQKGVQYLRLITPHSLEMAQRHFLNALRLEPEYPDALMGNAEVLCLQSFFQGAPNWLLLDAANAIARIEDSHSASSKATILSGALALLLGHPTEAAAYFEKAAVADRDTLNCCGWYYAFLACTDPRALRPHITRYIDKIEHNTDNLAIMAGFLYICGELDFAETMLRHLLSSAPHSPVGLLVLALLQFAKGKYEDALQSLQRLKSVAVPFIFPGLVALVNANIAVPSPEIRASALAEVRDNHHPIGFQIALWLLSSKDPESASRAAIEALDLAWRCYEPFVLFLRTLPLFDCLRWDQSFRDLADKALLARPRPPRRAYSEWLPGRPLTQIALADSPPDVTISTEDIPPTGWSSRDADATMRFIIPSDPYSV